AVLSDVHEGMIAKMIVCVRDQNVEYDSAPQRGEILTSRSGIWAKSVRDLQVTVYLAVARTERTHCREERDSAPVLPIEAMDEQDLAIQDALHSRSRNVNPGSSCQFESDGLPDNHVVWIGSGGELGNQEGPVPVANRCFRPRTSERGARIKKEAEILCRLLVVQDCVGGIQRPRQVRRRRNTLGADGFGDIGAILRDREAKRALPNLIVGGQQVINLAKRPWSTLLGICTAALGARDEVPSPTIGCRVTQGTEHQLSNARLERSRMKRQSRLERETLRVL